MDISKKILANERYKNRIDQFTTETLQLIAKDHIKALEYAQKGIEQVEPERINNVEYLEIVADGMQQLAQAALETRSKKT